MNYTKEQLEAIGRRTIEQRAKYTAKRLAKVRLILQKAAKANIKVSDAEVLAEMKKG